MISKVTLKQLYKDTFKRSTLIAIPQLTELLEVPGSEFTKWEIFSSIVRESLKNFEYYYPLCLTQKMYIMIDTQTRKGYLNGNFEAYLKGIVGEDQIVLLPAAISGLSTSYYTASTYPLRNFKYEPPYITDCWYASGTYYVNSICRRPFFEEYEEASKEPTDKCAVYYMNYREDSQYFIFYDEVYLGVCRYLMNLKKNMMLQNMPIELFQGLEEDYQNLSSKQDQIYQQALPSSYWMI